LESIASRISVLRGNIGCSHSPIEFTIFINERGTVAFPGPTPVTLSEAMVASQTGDSEAANIPPTGRAWPVRAGGRPDLGNQCCRRGAANGCVRQSRRRLFLGAFPRPAVRRRRWKKPRGRSPARRAAV